jgi:hypothetical protein
MKRLYILVLLLTIQYTAFSQTTICEKNTFMYFACYKLNQDSSFSYQYIDGIGEKIGIGTYTQNKKEIILRYDSLSSPIIEKNKIGSSLKSIKIRCSYILDSFPKLFTPVVYNNKLFFCDSLGSAEIRNYDNGPILIHNYVDSIHIHPDIDNCNNYSLFTHSPGSSFIAKGTVQVLEKKGKFYRRKIRSYFDKKGNPAETEAWRYTYFDMKKG